MIVIYRFFERYAEQLNYGLCPEVTFFNICYKNNVYGAALVKSSADEIKLRNHRKLISNKRICIDVVKGTSIIKFIYANRAPGDIYNNYIGYLDLDRYDNEIVFGTSNEANISAEFKELITKETVRNIAKTLDEYGSK